MSRDKELIRARFASGFERYNRLALVQQRICEQLVDRFCELDRGEIEKILEIGVGTGFLTSRLLKQYPDAEWYLNDLASEAEQYLEQYTRGVNYNYIWGDAEEVDVPTELNLIASASTLQWFNDVEAFIVKCSQTTAPQGWLLLSTFGKDNFREIRTTTGEGLEYYSLEELVEFMHNAGYRVVLAEEGVEVMNFSTPTDVLHHIKATGVNSLTRARWTHRQLREFSELYKRRYSTPQGEVTLTYHPILLIGQKI